MVAQKIGNLYSAVARMVDVYAQRSAIVLNKDRQRNSKMAIATMVAVARMLLGEAAAKRKNASSQKY